MKLSYGNLRRNSKENNKGPDSLAAKRTRQSFCIDKKNHVARTTYIQSVCLFFVIILKIKNTDTETGIGIGPIQCQEPRSVSVSARSMSRFETGLSIGLVQCPEQGPVWYRSRSNFKSQSET